MPRPQGSGDGVGRVAELAFDGRARIILDALPQMISYIDADLVYRYANRTYQQYFGLTPAEIIGRRVPDLIGERAWTLAKRHVDRVLGGERVQYEETYEYPGLPPHHIEGTLIPHCRDGHVLGYHAVLTDRTGSRHTEQRLRASEERYRTIIEQAPNPIMLVRDGVYIYLNDAAAELLGPSSREELIGHSMFTGMSAESIERIRERAARATEGQANGPVELTVQGKDGRDIVTRSVSVPVVLTDGPAILIMGQDVTELKTMERRLRHSEKLEAIGQLAGGVAHDFNNQLGGILGYADLLANQLDDPRLKHFAQRISAAAEQAGELTRSLLAFSRRAPFEPAPVDVHPLIGQVVDILRHSVDKRIDVVCDLRAEISVVSGDAAHLENALLNLGLNARDAIGSAGTISFATRCGEAALLPGEGDTPVLLINVSDTGCGIPADIRDRIFEPFFTTKPAERGTGMGLAAVSGTVEQHGGTIAVESEAGTGSTFSICLPLLVEVSTCEPGPTTGAPTLEGARLLVIDDENVVRSVAAELLEDLDCTVHSYGDPEAAVEWYGAHWLDVDLVLLDMVMPGLGGTEVFRRLRQVNAQARVLLISGYAPGHETENLVANGAVGFLQKPFPPARLAQAIADALE